MPYFLKHHFDPSFDNTQLKPRELADGSVDHYNLGYVQNVKRGQVVAEWVDSADDASEAGGSPHVLEEKLFPAGKNTVVDPDNADRLLAGASGYVFYNEGVITVKKTLNVRRDVDFHTGNINFFGTVVVHGCVRSGFQVQGSNVLVKEPVGGAMVRATQSFLGEGGIKGNDKAIIKAGTNFRVPFAEKAMLLAGGRMLIDGACMHCNSFAGEQLAVKGRLVGGQAVCTKLIYVGEQLGGGMGAETILVVGFDAMLLNKAQLLEEKIAELMGRVEDVRRIADKHPDLEGEWRPKLDLLEDRLNKFRAKHTEVWSRIRAVEDLEQCRVCVPGKVRPGVEICIGPATLAVDDFMEDVCFRYRDREIVVTSPAMKK